MILFLLSNFMMHFNKRLCKEVMQKKELLKNGTLTPEEYLFGREQMLRDSAGHAMEKLKSPNDKDEKELKEIKRKAAIEAIKMHMMEWRQSVLAEADERLTSVAKQRALIRIDQLERKLVAKESMKWGGLSVVKTLALAVMYMQEVVDDTKA